MCVTDTGSGRRQEPLLGFNIPKECVFSRGGEKVYAHILCSTIYTVCITASYMLCVMPAQFSGHPWTLV